MDIHIVIVLEIEIDVVVRVVEILPSTDWMRPKVWHYLGNDTSRVCLTPHMDLG